MTTIPVEQLNASRPGDQFTRHTQAPCSVAPAIPATTWAPRISDRVKVTPRPGEGLVDVNLCNVEIALNRTEAITLVEDLLEAIKRAEA